MRFEHEDESKRVSEDSSGTLPRGLRFKLRSPSLALAHWCGRERGRRPGIQVRMTYPCGTRQRTGLAGRRDVPQVRELDGRRKRFLLRESPGSAPRCGWSPNQGRRSNQLPASVCAVRQVSRCRASLRVILGNRLSAVKEREPPPATDQAQHAAESIGDGWRSALAFEDDLRQRHEPDHIAVSACSPRPDHSALGPGRHQQTVDTGGQQMVVTVRSCRQ